MSKDLDTFSDVFSAFTVRKLPASELVKKIKLNDSLYEELRSQTRHLPALDVPKFDISRRLYHLINDVSEVPTCGYCGSVRLFYTLGKGYCHTCGSKECFPKYRAENIKKTCLDRYGVDNPKKIKSVVEKTKITNLGRYGNTCPLQSKDGIEKKKVTWMKKYGVDHPMKGKESFDKLRKTNLKRYGFECSFKNKEVQEKYKKTCLRKYGVDSNFKIKENREKSKATCLKKYGIENPMQDAGIFSKQNKNMAKYKLFVFPSGRQVKVRGYENLALTNLLKNFNEDDLLTNNKEIESYIGKIFYFTEDGKRHRYFPDIYIKSQNKIVEVKSKWTYELHPRTNALKRKASEACNILFEFMILDKSGRY